MRLQQSRGPFRFSVIGKTVWEFPSGRKSRVENQQLSRPLVQHFDADNSQRMMRALEEDRGLGSCISRLVVVLDIVEKSFVRPLPVFDSMERVNFAGQADAAE